MGCSAGLQPMPLDEGSLPRGGLGKLWWRPCEAERLPGDQQGGTLRGSHPQAVPLPPGSGWPCRPASVTSVLRKPLPGNPELCPAGQSGGGGDCIFPPPAWRTTDGRLQDATPLRGETAQSLGMGANVVRRQEITRFAHQTKQRQPDLQRGFIKHNSSVSFLGSSCDS